MKTIAVVNLKGGVGKTTTSLALTGWITNSGSTCLAIDLDSQCNLTAALALDAQKGDILGVLTKKVNPIRALQKTAENGYAISGCRTLAVNETMLGNQTKQLSNTIEPLKNSFDYCIIDCSPALGVITLNALALADYVVIPMRADRFSLMALQETIKTIKGMQTHNPQLKIAGIIITMHNPRATVNRDVLEQVQAIAEKAGVKIYSPHIRRSVTIEEGQYVPNIFSYAPKATAVQDYNAVIQQIIGDVSQ